MTRQPKGRELTPEARASLGAQLVKLGDMMGDGLHLEPGGKQIERDYRRVAKALGYLPAQPRRNHGPENDAFMAKALEVTKCPRCAGQLAQSRVGSLTAVCGACGAKLQVGKRVRRRSTSNHPSRQ